MNIKPIQRNIQHQPKIWGITYLKLFASLFLMLFCILGWHFLVARGLVALLFGVGVGGLSLGVAYLLDRRDPVERPHAARYIRRQLTAYVTSNQTVRLKGDA